MTLSAGADDRVALQARFVGGTLVGTEQVIEQITVPTAALAATMAHGSALNAHGRMDAGRAQWQSPMAKLSG